MNKTAKEFIYLLNSLLEEVLSPYHKILNRGCVTSNEQFSDDVKIGIPTFSTWCDNSIWR